MSSNTSLRKKNGLHNEKEKSQNIFCTAMKWIVGLLFHGYNKWKQTHTYDRESARAGAWDMEVENQTNKSTALREEKKTLEFVKMRSGDATRKECHRSTPK